MKTFEKLLWIELIGFDNQAADYGVGDLLSRMEVKPEGVSLLLWNAEIIHSHTDLSQDAPIGAKHCAYCARPYNEERKRQDWTKFQLKGLIDSLHSHGVDAYVSVFDQLMSKEWQKERGIPEVPEWIDGHSEVRYVTNKGVTASSICPWKHLRDGSLYEDFFFAQLSKFMLGYGFDGLHAADGFAHPRFSINEADFSDDVIGQFSESEAVTVPPGSVPERSAWILKNVRAEWIEFHTKRHLQLWRKGMAMLKGIGKKHVFHNSWTRDPFEARYRYGVDYRMLAEGGVENFIIEAQAGVIELEGWNHSPAPMQDIYRAMMPRVKAYLPECKLLLLNCVKDGMEQYSALRHGPTRMESDIFSMGNAVFGNARAIEGVMTCLSDGIKPWEWHTIDSTYRQAFESGIHSLPYGSVLWSDSAFRKEFEAYVKKPVCSSFRLHYRLLGKGAVMPAVTTLDELAKHPGPVILLHPVYFTEEEQKEAMRLSGGNLIRIGLEEDGSFVCRVWRNGERIADFSSELVPPENPAEAYSWLQELPEILPLDAFLEEAARVVNRVASDFAPVIQDGTVRLWGFYREDGTLRLFAGNEKPTYNLTQIRIRGAWSSAEPRTDYPALPPWLERAGEDTLVRFKIPPAGSVIIDLKK